MKKRLLLILLAPCLSFLSFSQENCANGIDDDGDGLIDCYDPDCTGNASCDGYFFGQLINCSYPPSLPLTAKEDWTWGHPRVFSTQTPIAGDIDADGVVEVIVGNVGNNVHAIKGFEDSIFVLNGVTGTLEFAIKTTRSLPAFVSAPFAIGDVDNDGFGEIVIWTGVMGSGNSGFECYEHDGTLKWVSTVSGPDLDFAELTPQLADFNGDGMPEIYAQRFIFSALNGNLIGQPSFVPPGANGYGVPTTFPSYQGFYIGFSVAMDILPNSFCPDCAGPELVAGDVVFSVSNSLNTLTPVASLGLGYDGFPAVADLDVDGDLEIVCVASSMNFGNFNVVVWDPLTSSVIFISPDLPGNFDAGGLPNIGNFDADPELEIGFAGTYVYYVLDDINTGFATKWSIPTTDDSGITSSILFDFQGNGEVEVIYQDETQLFVLDGNTGAVLFNYPCGGGTTDNHPIVVDVDNDDQAEIICTCSQYLNNGGSPDRLDGYVVALGADVNPWVSARRVWNQGPYFIVNVEDDLGIPAVQQSPQLVPGGATNGYLVQQTILDNMGQPAFIASDATISILGTSFTAPCQSLGNMLEITVLISNSGQAVLPVTTPIAIYNGDPSQAGAQLIGQSQLTVSLLEGQSTTMVLQIPAPLININLFVVIDDAGIGIPNTLPNAGIAECDYSNNTASNSITSCLFLGPNWEHFEGLCYERVILEWKYANLQDVNHFNVYSTVNGVDLELEASLMPTHLELMQQCRLAKHEEKGRYYCVEAVLTDFATDYSEFQYLEYARDNFWMWQGNNLVSKRERYTLLIFSSDGKQIAESTDGILNTSPISPGIYLVRVEENGQTLSVDQIFIP